MDPTACLERLLRAIADRDTDEIHFAAEDLAEWIANGGFSPVGAAAAADLIDKIRLAPWHQAAFLVDVAPRLAPPAEAPSTALARRIESVVDLRGVLAPRYCAVCGLDSHDAAACPDNR